MIWTSEGSFSCTASTPVLEWSVIAIANAMIPTILKLNHWKFEQNGAHFVWIFNGFDWI